MEFRTIRILFVGTNDKEIQSVQAMFEKAQIANKLYSVNGIEAAVSFLNQTPPYENELRPDLILMDIDITEPAHTHKLKEISTLPDGSTIPVILLLKSDLDRKQIGDYISSINGYIKKPVTIESFMSVIDVIEDGWFKLMIAREEENPVQNPSSKMHILLVEDNPGDIDLTRLALERGKLNSKLDVVTDGEQALDYLFKRGEYQSSETPDIILLDLNLPKLDGRNVITAIKSNDSISNIPVIIFSSSSEEQEIKALYHLNANSFITKPTGPDDFCRVVCSIEEFWSNSSRSSQ